ncbi:hypothetical protein F4818DRAFT_400087 [Hypoxylon cercidicola]|nr:hypothetical protein F4818DRAFT_400087 [Hypoxylon cercidicola]
MQLEVSAKRVPEFRRFFSRKSAEIAPWTGIAQSFFDLETEGPYLQSNNTVSRANIWRLRRDCSDYYPEDENYREAPLYPWPPFGVMRAEDIDTELQTHLKCTHRWKYQSWTWLLPKHKSDKGYVAFYQPSHPIALPVVVSDKNTVGEEDSKAINQISRHLTERIFSWRYHQVEEGFTDTIVPRRWDNCEPPEPPSRKYLTIEAIVRWRDEVRLSNARP